jgi:Putative auto-transporter adhesin, head GIN domain
MKKIFLIVFVLHSFCLFAQKSGNRNAEDRSIESFDRIDISGHFDIYLKKGDKPSLKVEARYLDLDEIITRVSGNTLRIESTKRNFRDGEKGIIYITYASPIRSIDMSGAGNIVGESTLEGEDLDIELSGAGNIELDIDVKTLDLDLSGAGNLDIVGKAKRAEVSVSGAGNFRGYKLICEEMEIRLSGVGKAEVHATETLYAEASGIGKIRYRGEPKKLRTRGGFLGNVKPD